MLGNGALGIGYWAFWTRIGLTHTLRILGALGVLAVREIKLFSNFCVSPIEKRDFQALL
ncbi:hypothetical protein NIES4072_18750 [Nostoc commune NIES-4072]|uniref:Uncharacterized protein n=1 Tax=Nostoc commune NIES-4072 TaxID=2005467 RepID=A0A2R5FQW8_NOSCO|nr:hypothetical protein NIES4070_08060 [Nostoc commune HK-02]GBG18211.1 hypothetical protein NIES4072_18750 [Nostoc commune NIES-4072]